MNRFFSIILSVADEMIPYFRPSNRRGFISFIFIVSSNSIPVIGVIYLNWNPYMILLIYWGESLIIGIFNILKMMISGAIQDGKFSPSGFAAGTGSSVFFTVHYGTFMFIHGVFIVIFMLIAISEDLSGSETMDALLIADEILAPGEMTAIEFLESEFAAVAALFISHLVSFYLYFLKTGEYNYTIADNYMTKPYKRIIVMHFTIILGAVALFISGFKSVIFIIIWIGLKILLDLKMQINEIKNYRRILLT